MNTIQSPNAVALTKGPHHHWFGYYEKCPWDASGRWLLTMESPFKDRPPEQDDIAMIGLIDTQNGSKMIPLAETRAWNWQQGSMLQWLGDGTNGEIIFNDREGDRFVSRIMNVHTQDVRTLHRPVYTVNKAGTLAISLNFARLHHQRPGYGYAGLPDPFKEVHEPEQDGLFSLDLKTGESRLIVSLAEAAGFERNADFEGKMHRFNHAQFGPKDRLAVLHRYKSPDSEVGNTRLLTLDSSGNHLRTLSDHGKVSHYEWWGEQRVVAWALRHGLGQRYFIFHDDDSKQVDLIPNVGTSLRDGHCSFSPDGRWMLTDTYPDDTHYRTLFLIEMNTGRRVDIGRFLSPPGLWEVRCDLHPRWGRDGKTVCFDSVHEGSRQMYSVDLSECLARHSNP